MAYDLTNIKIEGMDLKYITELEIHGSLGEHTVLTLKGLLEPEKKENALHNLRGEAGIRIVGLGEKKKTLFYGIICQIQIQVEKDWYAFSLVAKSATCKMDRELHSRTFQNLTQSYHQILHKIEKAYSNASGIYSFPDRRLSSMLVQYEETDWEFLKRIASLFRQWVIPAADNKGIRYFIGLPKKPAKNISLIRANYVRDMKGYYERKEEKKGTVKETDFVQVFMDSYQIFSLGDCVRYQGQSWYLREVLLRLEEGLLVGHYIGQKKGGILKKEQYPIRLIGMALEGTILKTENDKVKVHFHIDKTQEVSTACLIPYSTMSASSDGSGWYCMPEMGDKVRVSFPTKEMKDAFVLNAVNTYCEEEKQEGFSRASQTLETMEEAALTRCEQTMEEMPSGFLYDSGGSGLFVSKSQGTGSYPVYASTPVKTAATASPSVSQAADSLEKEEGSMQGGRGENDRMGDPNVLYLSTVYGKEVRLSPEGIQISCDGSSAVLTITSSGAISIQAAEQISVHAMNGILLSANKQLRLKAKEEIKFQCDQGGEMTLKDIVELKGVEVKID